MDCTKTKANPVTQPDHVISFVVDDAAKFQMQAWLFLHSLSKLGLSPRTQILLVHCGKLHDAVRRKAETCGAQVTKVDRFGTGASAYCNKLQQLPAVLATQASYAVLCDTDLGFLIDPCTLTKPDVVRAKPVDKTNPAPALLRQILDRAGFADTQLTQMPDFAARDPSNLTHRLNCNGGLYALPLDLLRDLEPAWRRWAEFSLTQGDLLGRALIHSDQIGFCLAMLDLGLAYDPLEAEDNFPLHLPAPDYEAHQTRAPRVLHYHRRIGPDGQVLSTGIPAIDSRISLFNDRVADARTDPAFQSLLTAALTKVA